MQTHQLIFIGVATLVAIVVAVVIDIAFRVSLRRRQQRIEKLRNYQAVDASTPVEKPLRSFKRRAKDSVQYRYSIFRRISLILAGSAILLITVFTFVDQMPQAIISILVGSAAIITGMAARPFIENFLSGIAITASRMLNIGDTILLNDNYGTIEDISPTHTVVKLWDWRRYIIPNSSMINSEFINYSLNDPWIFSHIEFNVSYEADIEQVELLALEAARSCTHYNPIEDPGFWVMKTTETSARCWLASWADSPIEAWRIRAEMRTAVIKSLHKNGIRTHVTQVAFGDAPQVINRPDQVSGKKN